MTMDQRWVEHSPEVMLETFHWCHGEGFRFILDDLLALPKTPPIIVEGFRPLPRLVKPLLTSRSQALWLLPSPDFRRSAFETRGALWEIPSRTSAPEKALENLLARDALFTERLWRDIYAEDLPAFHIDCALNENDVWRPAAGAIDQIAYGEIRDG